MRFLGVGESCDLGALYLRLVQDGHACKVHISDPKCASTFDGLVEKTLDWTQELSWVGRDGIIVFESVLGGVGAIQENLRADGYRVIGGCAYGDRLENDRPFAQSVLAGQGFQVLSHWEFDDAHTAADFVLNNPLRYVLKFNGYGSINTFVGSLSTGSDVATILKHLAGRDTTEPRIVLTPHIEGVEMGVGAYFTGEKFLAPACLDWEHKRLFPGDLGELTPEMGTVVTYERTQRFFELTLGKLSSVLKDNGYQGYINLNTIVNRDGIWPLEFTCRFGYPGFAILERLQQSSWKDIFEAMLTNGSRFESRPGYAVGVVVTTPPFPYTGLQVPEPVGLPIAFRRPLSADEQMGIHYGEVRLERGQLLTSGMYGWTMVVTGAAPSIAGAQGRAYDLLDNIVVPNGRFREDIGRNLIERDYDFVERLGLFGP